MTPITKKSIKWMPWKCQKMDVKNNEMLYIGIYL